jgi:hypothetical protein
MSPANENLAKELPRRESAESPAARERHERDDRRREGFLRVVEDPSLQPQTALEILSRGDAPFEKDLVEEMSAVTSSYGVAFETLDGKQREHLLLLYGNAKVAKRDASKRESAVAIEQALKTALVENAFRNIDTVFESVERAESPESVRKQLRDLMGSMATLAKNVSPEQEENWPAWKEVFERHLQVLWLKDNVKKDIEDVYRDVFEEYRDFIENELVMQESKRLENEGKPASIEELTQQIFGMTKEEYEGIKEANRANVAAYIEKNADEPPSTELIQDLYRINNDRIVPKSYAKMRQKGEEVWFAKRVGVLSEDVQEEMEDLEARARLATVTKMTKARYETVVAKLHNDLLDIHPFQDRNGSTSVLFAEFMMAKRGYRPTDKREKGYYGRMRTIFGNNPVAVGIVGYGHYQIANTPGYYEKGKTTKGKERRYQKQVEALKRHWSLAKNPLIMK